jgi:rRNA maturation endonuclease Nob1
MQVSLEYLYHFRCDRCQKWWTRADNEPAINEITFCPYCGHENLVEGIQTFLNAAKSPDKPCLEAKPD